MAIQSYAQNGELLKSTIEISNDLYPALGLSRTSVPRGLVGVHLEEGLVSVIRTPDSEPVKMKLGKLLTALEFPERTIRESGEKLRSCCLALTAELKIATTEEEILRVYREGPYSCMQQCDSVRVYASGDIGVAYLEVNNRILSRTVVCINDLIGRHYTDFYGFEKPLRDILEKHGYKQGDLAGCKMQLVEEHGSILAPFLDQEVCVDVRIDHLLIDTYGETRADQTNGYLNQVECDCCGTVGSELTCSEWLQQELCEACFEECHVYINEQWYHTDDETIVETEADGWMIRNECVYVDERLEWHPEESCVYNSYSEEYILKSDLDL